MIGLLVFSLFSGISFVHPLLVNVNYMNCKYYVPSYYTEISSETVRSKTQCSLLCNKLLACRMFQYKRSNKRCSFFWEPAEDCSEHERTEEILTYGVSYFMSS